MTTRRAGIRGVGFAVIAAVVALVSTGTGGAVTEAGCKLTGGGVATTGDRFRANAKVTKGEYTGRVKIVTAEGDKFRGRVTALQCRRDGGGGPGAPAADVNIADVEGLGSWNGVPGYEFAVTVHDHGEGSLENRLADDFAAAIAFGGVPVSFTGGLLVAGNIQIHPPTDAHP